MPLTPLPNLIASGGDRRNRLPSSTFGMPFSIVELSKPRSAIEGSDAKGDRPEFKLTKVLIAA